MLTEESLPIQEEKENTNLNEVIQVALDILEHRVETADPRGRNYINKLTKDFVKLENYNNLEQEVFLTGILYEAIFFIACKKNLPIEIALSTGEEDKKGTDFFLGPKRNPIDVTINEGRYPSKLKRSENITIVLPIIKIERNKELNTKDFLNLVYNLNMAILNNRYDNYEVLVRTERKRKGKKNKKQIISPTSYKYQYEKTIEGTLPKRKIRMEKVRYDNIIQILSMLKNFSI